MMGQVERQMHFDHDAMPRRQTKKEQGDQERARLTSAVMSKCKQLLHVQLLHDLWLYKMKKCFRKRLVMGGI